MEQSHLLGVNKIEFMDDAFEALLLQSKESNICVKTQKSIVPNVITGDFIIVDYSLKAIALFGDTKPIKEQLKGLGGRFNPKLTHDGQKKAGWIFSKSKEQEIRNLLTIK